jgi:hypothetical protein
MKKTDTVCHKMENLYKQERKGRKKERNKKMANESQNQEKPKKSLVGRKKDTSKKSFVHSPQEGLNDENKTDKYSIYVLRLEGE